jgi:hypothetical protein
LTWDPNTVAMLRAPAITFRLLAVAAHVSSMLPSLA